MSGTVVRAEQARQLTPGGSGGYGAVKRLIDVVLAFVGMLVGLPVMAVVAGAVAAESGLPVVYRQRRIGRHGEPFVMYKFRSMPLGSDRHGHRTEPGDARVTRVGSLLRATSLDELPQLVNVLRGDMSLVGPRPDVAAQLDDYAPEALAKRLAVRPGITGLAQAELRSDATPEQRLRLDLEYVDRRSLSTDMAILGATLARVARGG